MTVDILMAPSAFSSIYNTSFIFFFVWAQFLVMGLGEQVAFPWTVVIAHLGYHEGMCGCWRNNSNL